MTPVTNSVPSIPGFLQKGLVLTHNWDKRSFMESSTRSQSAPLVWKVALLGPLAVAIVLQVMSHRQADLHGQLKLSIMGNIFLFISLILQSLYLTRKSTKVGITLLIFTSAGLAYGLRVLLRAL